MVELRFEVAGRDPENLVFPVARVLNGGFAGRDQTQVRAHIEELAHLGVKDPGETPTFYPLVSTAVSQATELEVVTGAGNWGEAEPVILFGRDGLLLTVGSDHTDRDLEGFSILKSKQVYPNLVAAKAWRYEEVIDHWDDITLRAWLDAGRSRIFQDATLAALMRPEDLLPRAKALIAGDPAGTVFFMGTVAAKEKIDFTDYFECELADPHTGLAIVCAHRLEPIGWFKGVIEA
jgi:hypothetical protein